MINDSINRFLGVLCYPLVSMEAFKKDLVQEYICALQKAAKEGIQDKDIQDAKNIKRDLKEKLIEYIRQNFTIYSYDEIYLYLDKCYLYDVEKECYLHNTWEEQDLFNPYLYIMSKMASTMLSHRDGRIVFKYWKNIDDETIFGGFAGNNKITLFHSLNCHIPMDTIAIIYMITNQKIKSINCLDYFYGNIEVADQQLSRFLEKGVAENHLHKGVSRTFPSIWDLLMIPLTPERGKQLKNEKFIHGTKSQNKRMLFYILGCGVIRCCLLLEISGKNTFSYFNFNNLKDMQEDKIKKLLELFCDGQKFEDYYIYNFDKEDTGEIISYYLDLWNILESFLPEGTFREQLAVSILGENSMIHTFDEYIFLYYALTALLCKETSLYIKKCIIQYLRIRNYLFHISVQQKTIKGLDYFQQVHYSVNSSLNRINSNNFWKNAIREQLQNRDIAKIEFRSSMPDSYSAFKKEVIKFLKAYKEVIYEDFYKDNYINVVPYRRIPQIGLVIHFLKRPDQSMPEKCLQNGKTDCSYLQFGKLLKSYEKQIEIFNRLRSEFSELSRYLVGIDAASLENSTPVWVFVPIYEKARDSSIDQIGRNIKDEGYTQTLGFTFHAGEDFRHILSGLRRIDEVVEYLKFHAGDRIGHGIALGIQAREWKNQNPVIIIPQIEALENYLWAYDTLSKNYSGFQATILAYMEKRIMELSRKIYGDTIGITLETLILGYQKVFSFYKDNDTFQKEINITKKYLCEKLYSQDRIYWNAELLAAARHCKKFVLEMEKPIHYEITEQDLIIIEELQKILKQKLGKKGIVIEVNPSSNMAVADLEILEENQIFKINRIYDKQNLIVCVNSDDPAVFNTNVSNELAYIYYGMLEKNISRETALLWIDYIRENGINSSFIHRQEPDEILVKKLSSLIDNM